MTSAFQHASIRHSEMGLIPPSAVHDLELTEPITDIPLAPGYFGALLLVRLHGRPVGSAIVPVRGGVCRERDIRIALEKRLRDEILQAHLHERLESPVDSCPVTGRDPVIGADENTTPASTPSLTVALCTRDRSDSLADCLDSLAALQYPDLEILVVDNAPSDTATRDLVSEHYPDFRYVVEPVGGLSHARNRAIREARGEIIAFTDDDAIVDPDWPRHLTAAFSLAPEVACVTGLIVPLELETEPQIILESGWSYNRGYQRRFYRVGNSDGRRDSYHLEAYRFGAGANMAFRRSLFDSVGVFDPALGAGTPCGGGEDLDLFFRTLEAGHVLVYEPRALVRHRHRRDFNALNHQISNWVMGYHAYLARTWRHYPPLRPALASLLIRDTAAQLRTWTGSWLIPGLMPGDLIRRQLPAITRGIKNYRQAANPSEIRDDTGTPHATGKHSPIAIRHIDLSARLVDLVDATGSGRTDIRVTVGPHLMGQIRVENRGQIIPRAELVDQIAGRLSQRLLADSDMLDDQARGAQSTLLLRELIGDMPEPAQADDTWPDIAIVVATRNRPELLRNCLESLSALEYAGSYEVIVVNNNACQETFQAVIREFPGVIGIEHHSGGKSAALNRGIHHSRGEIVALIDDDVTVPPSWLRCIASAFRRNDVHAVTGPILPRRLDTRAEQQFERFLTLNRGFDRLVIGPEFFHGDRYRAVPTGQLGAGANFSLRRTILLETGYFDERLGPGTPCKSGEDLEMLYRIAKTGHTIVYEPDVHVQHQHRRTMRGLYRQVHQYGIGFVAFQLTTLMRSGDVRSLRQLLLDHPIGLLRRLIWVDAFPRGLLLAELAGNLLGPLALLTARIRFGKSILHRRPELQVDRDKRERA